MVSCPSGLTACGSTCRDLVNDRLNCGGCGVTCGSGQICSGSTCVISCPAGQVACGARCLDSPGGPLTCAGPYNFGNIGAVGNAIGPPRVQPTAGTVDWYQIGFPLNPNFEQHGVGAPRILFGQNDNGAFRFDVVGTCGGASLSCQVEGGGSTGLTDWQFFDGCAAGSCSSRAQTWPSTVFVQVRRITGGLDCSTYRLSVSR